MNKRKSGFTLLEVLISLAIFAILAVITSQALKQSFRSKEILFKETAQIDQIELAFALFANDAAQITARSCLGNEMRIFPPFVGEAKYLEFTRSDQPILSKTIKQPPLVRLAYLCKDNTLIRRRFAEIDSLDRDKYSDQVIFANLNICRFAYLNATLQVLPLWRPGAVKQNQQTEHLPKAIQLTVEHPRWGNIANLFIIPEALYANKNTQG
ncbi:MAG: hypothetical protein A3F18_00145 [Legionellales bacterium RIFCSPHIGHO2_12_FULL_37_14]|nr:MAG: hypothetical protein A3F18_00145 [Legionellales bacterium RIFCSPHIGHO2_12_FULL_37_14]